MLALRARLQCSETVQKGLRAPEQIALPLLLSPKQKTFLKSLKARKKVKGCKLLYYSCDIAEGCTSRIYSYYVCPWNLAIDRSACEKKRKKLYEVVDQKIQNVIVIEQSINSFVLHVRVGHGYRASYSTEI